VFNFLKNPFEKLTVENQEDMKKNIGELKEYFTDNGKNTIVLGLANIEKELKSLGSKIEMLASKVEKTASGKLDEKSLEKAGKASIMLGDGIESIITSIKVYSKLPESIIDSFVEGMAKIGESFEKLAKGLKALEQGGKALLYMAKGIFFFGLALLISGPIYLLALPLAIIVVGVIMGITWLFSKVMGDKDTMSGIEAGGRALAYIALGIILFGLALLVAAPIYQMAMSWSLLLVVGVIVVAVGLMWLLGKVYNDNIEPGIEALMWMGLAIVVFGIALVVASKIYEYLWDEQKDGMLIIGLVILAAVGVLYLLSKVKGDVIEGSIALVIIAFSIMVLAVGLYMFSEMFPSTDKNWATLALIGATIGGLTIAVLALGLAGPNVMLGAGAMILVSVAIIVLSFGLNMFADTVKNGYDSSSLGLLMVTIAGIAIEFGIIGIPVVAGLVALGAAAIIVAGAAIVELSHALKEWRTLNYTDNDAKDLQKAIVRIPMAFLGLTGDEGFFTAIKTAAKTADVMDAARKNAYSLIDISKALVSISIGIKAFQDLGLKDDLIGQQIVNVTEPLITKFATIGKEHGGAGMFGLGGGDVYKGISSVMGMGNALTNIAHGMHSMADLKFPIYGKDGEIESYFGLDDGRIVQVGKNIEKLIGSLTGAFIKIGKGDETSWWQTSNLEKGINMVKDIGTPLASLAMGMSAMAELRFPNAFDKDGNPTGYINLNDVEGGDPFAKVTENIGLMIGSLTKTYTEIGEGDKSKWYQKNKLEKGINMVKDIGTPISSLAAGFTAMADLRFPNGFDAEGNPTSYIDLNQASGGNPFETVTNNIKKMITSLTDVFTDIGSKDDSGWFSSSTIENGIEIVMGIGEPITMLADNVAKFAKAKVEGFSLRDTFKDIFFGFKLMSNITPTDYKSISKGLTYLTIFTNKANSLADNAKEFKSIDKSFNGIAKSMGVLKDNVNGLDIKLLSETKGLFEAMAVISNSGSTEQIISKYGKTLETTFKNLADLLEQFGSKVTESSDKTVTAINTQTQSNQSLTETIKNQKEAAEQAPPLQNAQNSQMLSQLREIATILRGTIKVKDTGGFFS
jgi:hypothetical protein